MVAAAPAIAQQPDRGVEVLGDRLGGDAADLEQRVAVDQRRRAAPVGGAVAVLAGADDAVEERLLVAADRVVLGRVVVEEVVRGLDHGHALVVEVADQGVERVGHRHVVGIEDEDQVALGPRQRRVEVAGLGVGVVGADQVAGPGQPRYLLHLGPAAVVEQIGRVRVGQRPAAGQGRHHHLGRLVVGADVDVDRAPRRRRWPHRRRPRPGEPGEDRQRVDAVELGRQQHREERRGSPLRRSSRSARSGSRRPRSEPAAPACAAAGDGDRRIAPTRVCSPLSTWVHRAMTAPRLLGVDLGPRQSVRRGWDSNPRAPCDANSFRDCPVQPLRHPSRVEQSPILRTTPRRGWWPRWRSAAAPAAGPG